VAVDPYIADDELPKVEQGVPLFGTAIVPVGLDGAGLVPADVISVAPKGIPVGAIGEPNSPPSGDVAPTVGVGTRAIPPTCATATLQARSAGRAAAISETFTCILRSSDNSRPDGVGKIDDDRCWRTAHDNPAKRVHFRQIDFHMRQIGGNVNEIARYRLRDEFAFFTPTNLASSAEDECDRLLTSVMVNSRPRAGLDFENAAPDCRTDSKLRRDCARRSQPGVCAVPRSN
jgi:hypothetical protein